MATFPGAIPSYAGFTAGDTLKNDNHASQHNSEQGDISALATKIGTGSSTPTSGMLLRGSGVGTSVWSQVTLTSDVSGVLPQANGGTGTTLATGTGKAVYDTSPTISGAILTASPTLTTPVIADFTNAAHTHASSTQGGILNATNALQNTTVTADKLNTGSKSATINTSETTASTSYTDLATAGPSVTVTIGANGLALIILTSDLFNSGANYTAMSYTITGANSFSANDTNALANSQAVELAMSWGVLLTGLTAGSTTFTAKYRVSGGTGTFVRRNISVIPL